MEFTGPEPTPLPTDEVLRDKELRGRAVETLGVPVTDGSVSAAGRQMHMSPCAPARRRVRRPEWIFADAQRWQTRRSPIDFAPGTGLHTFDTRVLTSPGACVSRRGS